MGLPAIFSATVLAAVFLSTAALLAVFLLASAIAAWNEERAKRAVAVVRGGGPLRAGFGTFRGTAQNLDARSGGELVRRSRTEVSMQAPNGPIWRDAGTETAGRTFLLLLDNGTEIEVDASKPRLVGFPETTSGAYTTAPKQEPRRVMSARVSAGDAIWATGVLTRVASGAGAYRSSVMRRKLRAPRRGELELSTESPVARWTALAAAHKRGAYAALGALATLHALFFRDVDAYLFKPEARSWEALAALHRYRHPVEISAAIGVVIVLGVWILAVRRARAQRRG